MAEAARVLFEQLIRKPPGSEGQYNWITGGVDVVPEQMELPLPPLDDAVLPDDGSVILLATENGSQLFVSGFGLFVGKKSERVVVKQGKSVCAQVPLMRLQEIIIASRGISFSSDLIEELCERGIRIAFLNSSGKPLALITSPMLTATVETRARNSPHARVIAAPTYAAGSSPASCTIRKSCSAISRKAVTEKSGVPWKAAPSLSGGCGAPHWQVRASRPMKSARRSWVWKGRAGGSTGSRSETCCQMPSDLQAGPTRGRRCRQCRAQLRLWHPDLARLGRGHERRARTVRRLSSCRAQRQTVAGSGSDGGVSAARRRPGHSLVAEQGRPASASEGHARCGVEGKCRFPRVAAPDRPEQHRGKQHQVRSIIQMQARLAASAVRGFGPTDHFVQVVSRGAKESIYRRSEASARGQGSPGGVGGADL